MGKTIASLYEITRQLGSGGNGIVYLARHLRLEKNVVLKADLRSLREHSLSLLKHEADLLKNLNNAHIPKIYDLVCEGDTVYTVMDYIEGESLDKALDKGVRFAPPQVVSWAGQILEALVYLHGQPLHGILHSDIKPANLIRTPQNNIRLIDFNIALALGGGGAVSVGRSQGYASPEHYDSGVLDARSDIYGLGATLYHLLTGRCPAKKATEVIPLTSKDCPAALASIINKAMSPDRDSRFRTAGDMLTAFINYRRQDPRFRRQRRLRVTAAAVLSSVLLASSFIAFTALKRIAWDSEAEALVEASRNALRDGDVTGAVRLALGAIPSGDAFFKSPVSAGAVKSLTDALGVYDLSEGYKPFRTISLPSTPLAADLAPDGGTAAIVCAYDAIIVDLQSGETVFTAALAQSALAEARFLGNDTLVLAGQDGMSAYDIATGSLLWVGPETTAIAVSADGGTVAAVSPAGGFATVLDSSGRVLSRIDFGGRKRRSAESDAYFNPRDGIFALSSSGEFLAVSFADGTLSVYHTLTSEALLDLDPTETYVHYCGGFSGEMLAFSATTSDGSDFAVYDMRNPDPNSPRPKVSADFATRFGVVADESGIFVSWDNEIVEIDPETGKTRELAWTASDVTAFAVCTECTLAVTDGACVFFDRDGREVSSHERPQGTPYDLALVAGEYALVGGRDGPDMAVFRLEKHDEAQLLAYDASYRHSEARVNASGDRFMLFSPDGFQLYDSYGTLIVENTIPNPEDVRDQQYIQASGNLAVMYTDALLILGGRDGATLFSETDLRSVFWTPYGVSILDAGGRLRLIDLDYGDEVYSAQTAKGETFAAYCGMMVDTAFLGGRSLIGAAKTDGGYLFAVSDGHTGSVYRDNGKELFSFPAEGSAEAFFVGGAVVASPAHGTPSAYSLKDGGKIADLEKDAYLTYISMIGEGIIVSQYLSTGGTRFGILQDTGFQPIASLPRLCGTWDGKLVFDYPQGALRCSSVYELEELAALAALME